ncbi:MAG TPA: maltotransferase domain-containing protein, partial [Rhodopila sp.]|nr:maltotransferase domain-containing protein [Rhodopila sp.]
MTPKIYHLHPLVAGEWSGWAGQFARVGDMGFSHVCTAPPFLPGETGDIFSTADYERLHPALGFDGDADEGLASLSRAAERHSLRLMCDILLDEIAADAPIRQREPGWFSSASEDDLPDPRRRPTRIGASRARFDNGAADALTEWWCGRLRRLLRAGLGGFRFLHPQRVPRHVWHRVVAELRDIAPDCLLLAWTPGEDRRALGSLAGVGFDRVCASTAWWDGRASWLLDELRDLSDIAPALASPEPSFSDRLVAHLPPDSDAIAQYRHALRRAATIGDGWLMPMGFEFAARMPFDAVRATPADLDLARAEAPVDLSADVASANALVDQMASLNLVGPPRSITTDTASATALLRIDALDVREARRAAVAMINADAANPADLPVQLAPLPPQSGAAFSDPEPFDPPCSRHALTEPLGPGEVRIVTYSRLDDIAGVAPAGTVTRGAMEATRIAIEALSPSVPDGDYAVKRVVGEEVTVFADLVADGHEVLAAALLWRPADEAEWQRVPMRLVVEDDRWQAGFTPARIGPHLFTIEAWWDLWGTYRHDLHAKHAAGQALTLEIEEGRRMIVAVLPRAAGTARAVLLNVLEALATMDEAGAVGLLLSDDMLAAMQAVDDHPFATRHAEIRLDVDRPQAMFASWYEMFPRSASNNPAHHGTWNDVIRGLPSIRAMGFDVLYFPPIHPIGSVNRKGRNNALNAEPGDVGSPYAIGGAEGGHDAI